MQFLGPLRENLFKFLKKVNSSRTKTHFILLLILIHFIINNRFNFIPYFRLFSWLQDGLVSSV